MKLTSTLFRDTKPHSIFIDNNFYCSRISYDGTLIKHVDTDICYRMGNLDHVVNVVSNAILSFSDPNKTIYIGDRGLFHRLDGPAYITDHLIEWYSHGKLHRLDGPAVTHSDESTSYYVNGVYCPTLLEFNVTSQQYIIDNE